MRKKKKDMNHINRPGEKGRVKLMDPRTRIKYYIYILWLTSTRVVLFCRSVLGVGHRPARIVRLIGKHPTARRRFVRDDPRRSFLDRATKLFFAQRGTMSDDFGEIPWEKRPRKTRPSSERNWSRASYVPRYLSCVTGGFNTFLKYPAK